VGWLNFVLEEGCGGERSCCAAGYDGMGEVRDGSLVRGDAEGTYASEYVTYICGLGCENLP
jgi:hypothetical protein